MRRALIFAAVLAVAVGLPVIAYSRDGTIPLDLTFTHEEGAGNGAIAGSFGGVPVSGTFTGDKDSGDWILTVDGQPFSNGTYTCGDSGCVFTGTTLMGRPKSFEFETSGLNGTFTGNLQGLFRNHGGWVSTVAKWSNTNLAPGRVGKIVSGAARLGGVKVQSGKVQDGTKIQRNTEKVKDGTKIQGNPARAGGNGKAGQAKDADKKGRGNETAGQGKDRGQGNGGQGNSGGQGNGGGGQGHGNSGGNGNGGGKGK